MRNIIVLICCVSIGCSKIEPTKNPGEPAPRGVVYTGQPLKDDRILCESRPYSDDDLRQATLDVVFTKLKYFVPSDSPSLERLHLEQAKAKRLSVWAGNIQNDKIKTDYLFWIASFEKDYAEIEENIKNPAVSTTAQDTERENREKSARAAALARCLPKPEEK